MSKGRERGNKRGGERKGCIFFPYTVHTRKGNMS